MSLCRRLLTGTATLAKGAAELQDKPLSSLVRNRAFDALQDIVDAKDVIE